MLRAGIVLAACLAVCLCVCLHKISKTTDRKLINMPHGERWVFGSWWHLIFDLENYFRIFLIQAIPFKWLYLATSFSVWRFILKIFKSGFSFKVMGPRSRSRQRKSGSVQLKNYWSEISLAWSEYVTITLDNDRSNLKLLTFWPLPLTLIHSRIF